VAGGQILLLRVQMERCSALHLAEEQVELPAPVVALCPRLWCEDPYGMAGMVSLLR